MAKSFGKLKVGLVGSGGIARDEHLPYWRELEEEGRVEILGVCDLIKERRETEAAKCKQARPYADFRKMLRAVNFDVIDVCTQNRGHAPITIDAFKAGSHVLVEKPMAMNARECMAMIDASKKARRKLMVAQHMRFEAGAEKLKEVVMSGALGRIYAAEANWLRRRGIPGWGNFHIAKESCGGAMIDIGVHMIDLCVWLMGCPKPVAVSGKVYRMFGDRPDLFNADWGRPYPPKQFDVEDHATGFVRFEKGITMHVTVSWAANIREETGGVMILGDKAGISTHPPGVYSADHSSLTSAKWDWLSKEDGHRREVRHFCECVEKNLPVRVQPEESLRVQKIIDGIYESSRRNKEIVLR